MVIVLAICLAQLAPASEIQWKGKDRWIRPACITLKKEGILVGYPDGLSRYQPTPMDYGSAVKASCERVERLLFDEEKQLAELAPLGDDLERPELLDKVRGIRDDLEYLPKWGHPMDLLMRLVRRFSAEIKGLGGDVPAMLKDLAQFRARVSALQAHGRAVVVHATFLPDTPRFHWVYQVLKQMRISGVRFESLSDSFGGLGHSHPPSRAILGRAAAFGCEFLIRHSGEVAARIQALNAEVGPGLDRRQLPAVKAELGDLAAEVDMLERWKHDLPDLRRFVDFFAFEIRLSGSDPDELKRSLQALG